jgi:hypothetical protein
MEFSGIAWHNVTEHLFLGELAGTMLFWCTRSVFFLSFWLGPESYNFQATETAGRSGDLTMIGRQERQVNNVEREFFQTGKGLRQGDSLSPLLFNIVVDVLIKMLQKVARDYLIKGLGTELVADGVISLQYWW